MPYTVIWLDEPRLLYVQMRGNVTLDEMREWAQFTLRHLDAHPDITYYTILEITLGAIVAGNLLRVKEINEINRRPNIGALVVVGLTPLIAFWMKTFQQLSGMRNAITSNMDEALIVMHDIRTKDAIRKGLPPPENVTLEGKFPLE
jgi:hypothetical protein